jgi:hypothetical protein
MAAACLGLLLPILALLLWLLLRSRVPVLLLDAWLVFFPLALIMFSAVSAAWGVLGDLSDLGLQCQGLLQDQGCDVVKGVGGARVLRPWVAVEGAWPASCAAIWHTLEAPHVGRAVGIAVSHHWSGIPVINCMHASAAVCCVSGAMHTPRMHVLQLDTAVCYRAYAH